MKLEYTANRIAVAEEKFIKEVMKTFEFTELEAETIMGMYRKDGVMRLDYITETFVLRGQHYWNREMMELSVELDKAVKAQRLEMREKEKEEGLKR